MSLYPLAQSELLPANNKFELKEKLAAYLVFGSYPEVVQAGSMEMRIETLTEIANAYLLKDILAFDRVKNSRVLLDLLKLLAFQIGSEVSVNELATQLGADVKTIQRYLDLLEKAFVIIRLGGFSRNLRQEVVNKSKYYFIDNGIRNAVIALFNGLDQQNDIGALWENFMFVERLKYRTYSSLYANMYFWRTYDRQEIDLVEEHGGKLYGYEFKWSENKTILAPKNWVNSYPDTSFRVINTGNYQDFVFDQK